MKCVPCTHYSTSSWPLGGRQVCEKMNEWMTQVPFGSLWSLQAQLTNKWSQRCNQLQRLPAQGEWQWLTKAYCYCHAVCNTILKQQSDGVWSAGRAPVWSGFQAGLILFEQLQKHGQHISWQGIMSMRVCVCVSRLFGQQTLISNLLSLVDFQTEQCSTF